jgi:aminobenzoyl-glutamate utilization protein B
MRAITASIDLISTSAAMSSRRFAYCLAVLLVMVATLRGQPESLSQTLDAHRDRAWEMAQKIWSWAEPGYQERQSAALLAETLEAAGFRVERGVAQIPTAFTATIGSGKPVIGILGEYDALPGLSQEPVPYRQMRPGGNLGHACGHHLFGVASASACLALGAQLKAGKIQGTLRYYGCPAEEGGAAKVYMVREGLFRDCDAVLHWHPSSRNAAGDQSCLSRIAVKFRFHGKSAHASGSPEKGRSALDAVELTNHAAQLLREHTPESTRIHHTITDGGGNAPNVVPEFAEVFYYIRHPKAETVAKLYPRLLKCAQAGALATETRLEVINLGGTMELLPNATLAGVLRQHLQQLNQLEYTDEERQFALRIQETLTDPPPLESIKDVDQPSGSGGQGSTDVGDVSWVVPTAGFSTACWVPGTPGHSWQAVAAGGMSIGRKGMDLAARVLAASAWELFHDSQLLIQAKADHQRRLAGRNYQPMLEPNQPPPLDYRDPPRRQAPASGE